MLLIHLFGSRIIYIWILSALCSLWSHQTVCSDCSIGGVSWLLLLLLLLVLGLLLLLLLLLIWTSFFFSLVSFFFSLRFSFFMVSIKGLIRVRSSSGRRSCLHDGQSNCSSFCWRWGSLLLKSPCSRFCCSSLRKHH